MPTATRTRTSADARREEILQVLSELRDVKSIELKLTVPGREHAALRRLGLDVLAGRIREVYFFDTPDLRLFRDGVVVRARRTQGANEDTVVKLRPAVPSELPPKLLASPDLKLEMDVTRGSHIVSASLRARRREGSVREAVDRRRPLEKLFSKEQRRLFVDHAPDGVAWSDLVALGPAYVVLLKYVPPDLGRRLTIEQWHYPGEVPLVELSTKAPPEDALGLLADSVNFLKAHGLRAEGAQEPKTRKALQFFSRQRELDVVATDAG